MRSSVLLRLPGGPPRGAGEGQQRAPADVSVASGQSEGVNDGAVGDGDLNYVPRLLFLDDVHRSWDLICIWGAIVFRSMVDTSRCL